MVGVSQYLDRVAASCVTVYRNKYIDGSTQTYITFKKYKNRYKHFMDIIQFTQLQILSHTDS